MSTQETTHDDSPALDAERQEQITRQLQFTIPASDALTPFPQAASRFASSVSAITDRPLIWQDDDSFISYRWRDRPWISIYLELQAARQAIEAKAGQLGWVGAATSDIDQVGLGYVIRYANADIYYSETTGAHEVHGDIRAKYNALGAATGVLGLPTTDETGTPDGVGRFNHFQGGSIYWTPTTGPMMVRGAIRDAWARQGWERGALGYPVADPDYKAVANPIGKPAEYASVFQNGALYSKGDRAANAHVAELLPQQLAQLVRNNFDRALKEADNKLGIEGGARILSVSDWGYGFWASQKRLISYEIRGFYSTPVVPDTTFRLELQFLFGLTWNWTFTEPVDKTLEIYLKRLHISTSGIGHGTLADRLKAEIPKRFPFTVRTIPAAALLIDILVTPQGGLQFLLEPNVDFPPIGVFRRDRFQDQLNLLLET